MTRASQGQQQSPLAEISPGKGDTVRGGSSQIQQLTPQTAKKQGGGDRPWQLTSPSPDLLGSSRSHGARQSPDSAVAPPDQDGIQNGRYNTRRRPGSADRASLPRYYIPS